MTCVQANETSILSTIKIESSKQFTDIDGYSHAGSSQIITQDEFTQTNQNLSDILKSQMGVSIRSIGGLGSFSQLSLRGSSSQQVSIYLDGILLNDANGGGVDLSGIPLSTLDRIEIYHNQAPIKFGQQFQGGVIQLVSKRVKNNASTLAASLGSFEERKLLASTSYKTNKSTVLLQLNHQQAKNNFSFLNDNQTELNPYDDKIEKRFNAQTKQQSALIKFNYKVSSKQTFFSQFTINSQNKHLPNQQNSKQNKTELNTENYRLKLAYENLNATTISNHVLSIKTDISSSLKNEHYLDPNSQLGLGKQDNRYQTKRFQISNYMELPLLLNDDIDIIGQLNTGYKQENYRSQQDLNSIFSQASSLSRQRQTGFVAFALPNYLNNGKFIITPSIHLQNLIDTNLVSHQNDKSLSETDINTNLGVIYNFAHFHKLSLALGTANRHPSFYEKYSDRGFVIGNPDLIKESSFQRDIGYEYNRDFFLPKHYLTNLYFNIHAYLNDTKDIIIQSYDARGIAHSYNMKSAQSSGIEIKTSFTTQQKTELTINTSYNFSTIKSDYSAFNMSQLPNHPKYQFNAKLQQSIQNFKLYYLLHIERDSFYDRANLLDITPQELHNIGIKYQTKNWGITFEANNLLDNHVESFNGYPSPGKNFHLTIQTYF